MQPSDSREVFRGRLIRVLLERWPSGEREIVRHPGACALVALATDSRVILVRQLREALGRQLLEVPAGVLDVAGEDPRACAARELLEETGFRAIGEVESMGTVVTSPGFADERIELFLCRTAEKDVGGPPAGEEGIEVLLLPLEEAVRAAVDGRIEDAKSVAAILRAWARVGSAGPPFSHGA